MKNQDHWTLTYHDYVPEEEGLREALCTLGNGYFATRGAASGSDADENHYPGTYLAGGYNRLESEKAGRVIENEDLVNMPNWLPLTFRIDEGEWFHLKAVEILSYTQHLHLKEGVLERQIRFKDAHDRVTTLIDKRLVHIRLYHLAAIERTIISENWSGRLEVRSALDGKVINSGVARYRQLNSKHLEPVDQEIVDDHSMYLKVQTNQSKIQIAQAARTKLYCNNEIIHPETNYEEDSGYIAQYFSLDVNQGDKIRVEKIVAMYTSRDHAISEPSLDAREAVLDAPDFESLLSSHQHVWNSLWSEFNIELELNGTKYEGYHPALITRLHIFHLLQTVSLNSTDIDVGVPARGWHGEAYRGHIFWDELFIFPTLNLRIPKITLGLLKYRWRRLNAARTNAKEAGYKGAMFPWQSGSTGREESQQLHLNPKSGRWLPDNSSIQRHVNIAIAYNAWRYYEVTGDRDFLRSYGAELILEIVRFWASLCEYNKEMDRYEIKRVMGPDEYHDAYPNDEDKPGLDNNGYTNLMVVWLMTRALDLLQILPDDHRQELWEMLDIQRSEIEQWKDISRKMRVCFHHGDIISQFEGYEKLKEFDWDGYRKKYGDIQRLDRILEAEDDSPNRYQLSKQADLLMLFYLLSAEEITELFHRLDYPFDPISIPKNIDYYLHRTSHGSTLSRIVHSWVLSREDRASSWQLFIDALESDIADVQGGTTPEGVHLGAMAGTVDIIQRCYTGIEMHDDVLWFNPDLPENLKKLAFHIHYRGHSIQLELTHKKLILTSRHSTAKQIKIGFKGKKYDLSPGETREFDLEQIQKVPIQ